MQTIRTKGDQTLVVNQSDLDAAQREAEELEKEVVQRRRGNRFLMFLVSALFLTLAAVVYSSLTAVNAKDSEIFKLRAQVNDVVSPEFHSKVLGERDEAISERNQLQASLDQELAEKGDIVAAQERIDELEGKLAKRAKQRDAARAERDTAIGERDSARAELDEALEALAIAEAKLPPLQQRIDELTAEAAPPPEEPAEPSPSATGAPDPSTEA